MSQAYNSRQMDHEIVIAAAVGGFAEQVIKRIAHPSHNDNPFRNFRKFGQWENGICRGSITTMEGKVISVTLLLGVKPEEGFLLRDDEKFTATCIAEGEIKIIPVSPVTHSLTRKKDREPGKIANQIMGRCVIPLQNR